MSNAMEKSWKNRLQEYCQKNKLRLPNYRIKQQAGLPNEIKFQVSILLTSSVLIKEDEYSNKCRFIIYFMYIFRNK
jgi:dsRNA-specific ribonuclease